ncbi:ABC transporter ATP-binding protein [Lichenihabitans sp. PAMC28606]|uniref:ABC transporter ATP-binding protein n=1 Tax=Lichenihabitans sp. PAMC28606 TaxID=2880932 RepID=UPI001D0A9C5B|nr:ABC transporter ATP-binding protein [Lichenihabitans sp. PAMC28606]UDL93017.1 ABC transporter ATP-binding protein [Lichenihabitans sp. PAMC28606]
MTDTALALTGVNKLYHRRGKGPVHAVRQLDMDIAKGEIVALLGSSGCGKTSTLRMVAGFEEVSSGTITLAGRSINALPPAKRNVAMAFEGYSLYPPLTVRENIAFALKSAKVSRDETDKRVAEIAALVEIESILDRYPSSISGGQQQRASLARALVRKADLYLLDEPMGQLEPQLRSVLRGRIKSLLNQNGMTAIFVTHDQTEANALADRIAVMEGGILQQFASQKDLKDRPANLFVATFIGEPPMNVFDAHVVETGGIARLAIENGPVLDFGGAGLTPAVRAAVGHRTKIVVGVRPHKVKIGAGAFSAKIVSNQWLGDQTHVAAEVAGKLLVSVTSERVRTKLGTVTPFGVEAADLHLFDPETGQALAHGMTPA